jgi:crotonobetainyl-CoA:carnitine CoA-transferase CaiB-like acyl-CoA transferase
MTRNTRKLKPLSSTNHKWMRTRTSLAEPPIGSAFPKPLAPPSRPYRAADRRVCCLMACNEALYSYT